VKTPVPAVEVETVAVEDLKTVPLVAIDESGKTTALVATVPVPAPVEPVQVAVAQAPTPVQPAQETLPHTASAMPLLGLVGLVSLALFAALGFRSRRACKA
jgi:LPXTG-motif cell wall-anchored protein